MSVAIFCKNTVKVNNNTSFHVFPCNDLVTNCTEIGSFYLDIQPVIASLAFYDFLKNGYLREKHVSAGGTDIIPCDDKNM